MKFAAHSLLSLALIVVAIPFLNGQQSAVSQTATAQAVSNPDAPDSCPHLFTSGNSASNGAKAAPRHVLERTRSCQMRGLLPVVRS